MCKNTLEELDEQIQALTEKLAHLKAERDKLCSNDSNEEDFMDGFNKNYKETINEEFNSSLKEALDKYSKYFSNETI